MHVTKVQNQPTFQANVKFIQTERIFNKYGQKALSNLEEILPEVLKADGKYGGKDTEYIFGLGINKTFVVRCIKTLKVPYYSKTNLGKFREWLKAKPISSFCEVSAIKGDKEPDIRKLILEAKEGCMATPEADSWFLLQKKLVEKRAIQDFKDNFENLKKHKTKTSGKNQHCGGGLIA